MKYNVDTMFAVTIYNQKYTDAPSVASVATMQASG